MSGLITARNRAAYKPAVWSQRIQMPVVPMVDYIADLTGFAFNGASFRLVAQAEWPDACPALVQWNPDSTPQAFAPSPLLNASLGFPAWPVMSDVAFVLNTDVWFAGGVLVKWWAENVPYLAVFDLTQGAIEIPVCDRVEVWMGAGVPESFLGNELTVRASISFGAGGSARAARCTTPWVEWNPSAMENVGQFLLTLTPPWAESYDVLTQVPPGMGPMLPSAVAEVDLSGGNLVPRGLVDIVGDQSLLSNATAIPAASNRGLAVTADPDAELARFRVSWLVRV